MTELETKLTQIKEQKDTYIIPENIKKDVTVFGVTGTLEEGRIIRLFKTVEQMNEAEKEAGNLALVANDIPYRNLVAGIETKYVKLSKSFTKPSDVTWMSGLTIGDSTSYNYNSHLVNVQYYTWGTPNPRLEVTVYTESGSNKYTYTTEDGSVFTCADLEDDIELELVRVGIARYIDTTTASLGIVQAKYYMLDNIYEALLQSDYYNAPLLNNIVFNDDKTVEYDVVGKLDNNIIHNLKQAIITKFSEEDIGEVEFWYYPFVIDTGTSYVIPMYKNGKVQPFDALLFKDDKIYPCSERVNVTTKSAPSVVAYIINIDKTTNEITYTTQDIFQVTCTGVTDTSNQTHNTTYYTEYDVSNYSITPCISILSDDKGYYNHVLYLLCRKEDTTEQTGIWLNQAKGLIQQSVNWVPFNVQLTEISEGDIAEDKTVLGKNGVITGDGTIWDNIPADKYFSIYNCEDRWEYRNDGNIIIANADYKHLQCYKQGNISSENSLIGYCTLDKTTSDYANITKVFDILEKNEITNVYWFYDNISISPLYCCYTYGNTLYGVNVDTEELYSIPLLTGNSTLIVINSDMIYELITSGNDRLIKVTSTGFKSYELDMHSAGQLIACNRDDSIVLLQKDSNTISRYEYNSTTDSYDFVNNIVTSLSQYPRGVVIANDYAIYLEYSTNYTDANLIALKFSDSTYTEKIGKLTNTSISINGIYKAPIIDGIAYFILDTNLVSLNLSTLAYTKIQIFDSDRINVNYVYELDGILYMTVRDYDTYVSYLYSLTTSGVKKLITTYATPRMTYTTESGTEYYINENIHKLALSDTYVSIEYTKVELLEETSLLEASVVSLNLSSSFDTNTYILKDTLHN